MTLIKFGMAVPQKEELNAITAMIMLACRIRSFDEHDDASPIPIWFHHRKPCK
jgi:hypothetical protein